MRDLRLLVAPAAAFLLCAGMAVAAARRPPPRPRAAPPALRDLAPYLLRLAGGGYLALLAIVAVFHVLVMGDRSALAEATLWGLALAGVAVPAFLALSALERRLRRTGA